MAGRARSSPAVRCSSSSLVTPLDTLAREYLVWAHLLQNVVLAEWAPLLLVLGMPADARRAARAAAARPGTHAPVRRAARSGSGLRGLARAGALRRRAPAPVDALLALEHATYLVYGHPLLVVRLAGRAAPALVGGACRLRLRGVRPLGAARARARARARAALRLLRRCARARLGPLPPDGPAARRDDDGRQSSRSSSSPSSPTGSPLPRRAGAARGSSLTADASPRRPRQRRSARRRARDGHGGAAPAPRASGSASPRAR